MKSKQWACCWQGNLFLRDVVYCVTVHNDTWLQKVCCS